MTQVCRAGRFSVLHRVVVQSKWGSMIEYAELSYSIGALHCFGSSSFA